jgi:hypothetical protein
MEWKSTTYNQGRGGADRLAARQGTQRVGLAGGMLARPGRSGAGGGHGGAQDVVVTLAAANAP